MAILRSERLGQGWGSLERNSLLSKEAKGQPQKPRTRGSYPWAPAAGRLLL